MTTIIKIVVLIALPIVPIQPFLNLSFWDTFASLCKKSSIGLNIIKSYEAQKYYYPSTLWVTNWQCNISFIRSFNQNFSTISWKNISQARSDVDKGMQMISFGASESDLKNQLSKIFSQMQDPDAGSSPGGIKG